MTPDTPRPLRSVEELIESERFAYKVLNASLNGLYVHDVHLGKNVFINSRYTALTGYTEADLEAMDKTRFFELFHPDDRRRVAEHMQKIVGSGEDMLEIEYRFKTKDDRWIWCLSRDSVFNRDADGSVCQFIGTFLDITDRKEVEEALRKRESLYRELVQSVNSAIVRYKKNGTITFLNEYAQSLFGSGRENISVRAFQSRSPLRVPRHPLAGCRGKRLCRAGRVLRHHRAQTVGRSAA
jgi:two-component system CheB/CheR fusion protein